MNLLILIFVVIPILLFIGGLAMNLIAAAIALVVAALIGLKNALARAR